MEMDLKALICFKKVAEREHISKAAEELFISQAHVSRIIAALEEEIGAPLFDRVGRGIQLNSCGRLYYEYTIKILSLLDESVKSVRDEYSRAQAQLIIGTNAASYLPNLFSVLRKKKSSIRIKQYSFTRKKLIQSVKEDKTDFMLICPLSNDMHMKSIPVHKEPAIIIYPENHWLKDRSKVSLHELENEDFVGMNLGYGARDAVEIMYSQNNFKPNFVVEIADSALIKQYVKGGMGIAVVPKTLMLTDPYYKNHYCEFEEDVYGLLSLEWKKDRKLSEDDIIFCNTTLEYYHHLGETVGTNIKEEIPTIEDFM